MKKFFYMDTVIWQTVVLPSIKQLSLYKQRYNESNPCIIYPFYSSCAFNLSHVCKILFNLCCASLAICENISFEVGPKTLKKYSHGHFLTYGQQPPITLSRKKEEYVCLANFFSFFPAT